jgi:aspartate aminotransferase
MIVSHKAATLTGSEIIALSAEINERRKNGEKIFNLTIGDFDPQVFPIPQPLEDFIIGEYRGKQTNYPSGDGMPELREALSNFIRTRGGLDYKASEFMIAGGARPLIYATFQALLNPGEAVVYPEPSWNNNHYVHLTDGSHVRLATTPEENFMPSASHLEGKLGNAALVALCSPLNPTGTVFNAEQLGGICDLILAENKRRGTDEKPVYLMYDQIYWMLTFGDTKHLDPVSLRPEMRPYTIYIDGLSKCFSATGVRVGWAFGPVEVINRMKAIMSHIGAWAPKAEQLASAKFINDTKAVDEYMAWFLPAVLLRLNGFYDGLKKLKSEGHKVDAISPQAAIYLTVQFDLIGKQTVEGNMLETNKDVHRYLMNEAKVALVPFSAFGAPPSSSWYRLSVGTVKENEISLIIDSLAAALGKLK